MKVFLAEYTMAHDPGLAPEGAAMLGVLKASFERCGYEVILPGAGDFSDEIRHLAPACDAGLVIAPDHLLFRYTSLLEPLTHNIGCGSMNAAVCAHKRRAGAILARHGITVPKEGVKGRRVLKPEQGCGAQGVRLSSGEPGEGEFAQEWIEGEHLSVSLVGSRLVGNACSYYTGRAPLLLAVNLQQIEIDSGGRFHYLGGQTPVSHPRHEEIVGTAVQALNVLGCQGYCGIDIVLSDRPYVVDVNPRITTSLVGIAACMEEEIADILVAASRGGGPDKVHLSGRVRFDNQGRVTRL
ncbi:MAG: ATP-grasp domain-containing protein [Methanoregulaceae archaeon]|nr:ATP-grasp domain-containing protein [Methanoregulaceae archaeon]